MKQQRSLCLGIIIGGERPEACIGCPLQPNAVNVTDEIDQQGVVSLNAPDLLQSLQTTHDIASDNYNRQQPLAQQIMGDVTNIAIAELTKSRKSVTDCPQYRRTSPNP